MSDIKQKIIDALEILKRRDTLAKEFFKVKAYKKAIDELKVLNKPVLSIDDIKGIPGIGEKITKKVVEILETGGLAAAEKAKDDFQLNALDTLSEVYGIGPAKAKALISGGIKTIAELRAASAKDPKLLNEKQKIGLVYYEDILERIPRSELREHEKLLLGNLDSDMKGIVVGSYRRGAESSGDIDVLITMNEGIDQKAAFASYIKRIVDSGYMIEILSQGDQKCLSVVRLADGMKARRLDLLVVPNEQFPYALLYFTGSGDFNIAFRKHALRLGYTLNEHEMKPTGKVAGANPVPLFRYEAEIFGFLGLKYKEPNQRIGAASVEELSENTKAKVAAVKKTRKSKKNKSS